MHSVYAKFLSLYTFLNKNPSIYHLEDDIVIHLNAKYTRFYDCSEIHKPNIFFFRTIICNISTATFLAHLTCIDLQIVKKKVGNS